MNKKEEEAINAAKINENKSLYSYEYVKILLNIIEKQEKEIEKLKSEVKILGKELGYE